ncbi:MAG: hypothetical protein QNJ54_34350 [Prochloraceae cyanobacterium]|nr:hypothetical protein [Prochloraceae cyanobacterium]
MEINRNIDTTKLKENFNLLINALESGDLEDIEKAIDNFEIYLNKFYKDSNFCQFIPNFYDRTLNR